MGKVGPRFAAPADAHHWVVPRIHAAGAADQGMSLFGERLISHCEGQQLGRATQSSLTSRTMSEKEPIVCAGGRELLQASDSCPDVAKQLARALCANCEESCPSTRADVERLKKCGAKAILVGESLLRDGDIQKKIRELLG